MFQYYIDRQAGMLYLYPPSDIATGEVVVSQLNEIISATGTSYVTIERFGVNFAQGSGIATSGIANMSFLHLDVSGQGRDGVVRDNHALRAQCLLRALMLMCHAVTCGQ